MYTEQPWHLQLFFIVLATTSVAVWAVILGYSLGYHWTGALALVAVFVATLVVLRYRARRGGPTARPPAVAETPGWPPASGWSPASLVYLVFGATTVAMVLVGLAAVVVGPRVVSGGVVASYLMYRIVRATRPVGSAGQGSGGDKGPQAHAPSLLEQMSRQGGVLRDALRVTAGVYLGVYALWLTFARDESPRAFGPAGTGITVLFIVLLFETFPRSK